MNKQILNKIRDYFHIHRYTQYVASRYVSFNSRDVIFECECGKRKLEKDQSADYILPFIETCDFWESRKFNDYLTNGKYHINSESHNKLWQRK